MGFIFRTIKSIIKLCIKWTLYLAVFATVIVLLPNLPPHAKFTSIEQAPIQPRVGPLAPNEALNNAAQRYKGKLLGPEAFQVLNGELYTSLATGEIVKMSPGGHVTFVTKVGQPCSGLSKEHICGRPLGFQIDEKSNTLYVSDAYHGIWKVDLNTDKKQLLVSPRVEIEKRQPKLFNSIALANNGDFYWTDSSSDLQLKDGAISTLLDPSGRIFYYNAVKNESKVIADGLWFPNGLVLSPNNEFLVIAESCRHRLLKHYIAGPKKGKTEVFAELPGVPDNVRVLPDGSGVLVGLYTVFTDENPLLSRSMSTTPVIRKFLARLQRLIEIPFEYLNSVYPHVLFEDIVYHIGHFKSIMGMLPPISGLIQVDWNGNIVASYYNTDKSLTHISDGIVYNNELHTANPHLQDFIGVVPAPPLLKQAFQSVKKVETKPKQNDPKTTPPPLKTTTSPPKPTTPPPKTTTRPPPKTTTPPPKTTTPPPPKTTTPPPPKTTTPPPPKTTTPPPPKTTTPLPPKTTTSPPPKTTPPPSPKPTPPPPKTTTPPKATSPVPTQPKPNEKTPSQTKEQTRPISQPEVKTTTPPKQTITTTPPSKATPKPEDPKKIQKQQTPKPAQVKPKEEIPIKEDIQSDTTRPPKEKLKVIRKGGVPTEIPVPNI